MIYLQLFLSFLQIGLFSIGGGYAAMPLIQDQTVTLYGWLSLEEFADLVTIAEMTPGPIALNAATFVGNRVAGLPGAMVATFGNVLPSIVIVSILAWVYRKYGKSQKLQAVLAGLRPAVVALIAGAGLTIWKVAVFAGGVVLPGNIQWVGLLLAVCAFVALRKFKWNPVAVMLACGGVNLLIHLPGLLK